MLAKATLNPSAQIVEDTQTDIRLIVKEAVFKKTPKTVLNEQIKTVIRKNIAKIPIKMLKDAAIRSLWAFYIAQYTLWLSLPVLPLIITLASNVPISAKKRAFNALITNGSAAIVSSPTVADTGKLYVPEMQVNQYGIPNQEYMQTYMQERVRPVLNRLCEEQALDPGDITERNSLRNRAEMEVRYNGHLRQIADLKARGVKLVIASTHADCSKRCAPYQGRVYSLDGSYGTTDDGRPFEPLENATNVPYTTKAGITYMNGLLGFNCRHFLVEYKSGYVFPEPNEAQERKEYGITKVQRYMERQVRKWETKAITAKGVDAAMYAEAKAKAMQWKHEYIAFSKGNKRAYYPSRIKIL